MLTQFCLLHNAVSGALDIITLLPDMITQCQNIGPKPLILRDHVLKLEQFDSFLMQRALRLYLKDKDRKAYAINLKERRDKMVAHLEEFSSRPGFRDSAGCSLFRAVFGESYSNLKDGIYIDFLHCFLESTSATPFWIYDFGLSELMYGGKNDKDKKEDTSSKLKGQVKQNSGKTLLQNLSPEESLVEVLKN